MSIEAPAAMGPEKHKSKSADKKHKSSDGEKKRKRDQKDDSSGQKSKSKKHKSDKSKSTTTTISKSSATENPDGVSPFHIQTSSLWLPLAPISQKHPLEGLCAEHISPLILTYYPPFSGVILSYSNARLSEKPFGNEGNAVLLKNIDEYAVSWAWVTADFLLFKPEEGVVLEGYVNLQNEGHLGVVCWNLFNASIERKRLPGDWRWVGVEERGEGGDGEEGGNYAEDGAGHFVDGEGNKVDGMVKFRVKAIESSHDRERGFLSIEGTMLTEKDENELLESEKERAGNNKAKDGRRFVQPKPLGSTSLGIPVEPGLMDADSGKKHKHRY